MYIYHRYNLNSQSISLLFIKYNNLIMGNSITPNQKDLLTSHPQFKSAKLIHHKDHHSIKSRIPCDEQSYNQWKRMLDKDIKQLEHSDFLLIPNTYSFERDNFCGRVGHVEIDYQCYPYLLSEQIARRRQNQQLFIEADLWFLLYVLTGARHQIQPVSGYVGDIRPENIFINQQGQVRVGCIYSFPNERQGFIKFTRQQSTYLAPEDITLIKQGTQSNAVNKKSQVFAIGLTVISAGILQDVSSIYDTINLSIVETELLRVMNKWKGSSQYSEIFRAIILDLVQRNQDDRLSGEQLWKWIVKYEASIKNKQKFVITTEHEIIEKEVAVMRGRG